MCVENTESLDLSEWYSVEMPEEGHEMMQRECVVPFGTGLWR